jgi:serine/threonine protein kinase
MGTLRYLAPEVVGFGGGEGDDGGGSTRGHAAGPSAATPAANGAAYFRADVYSFSLLLWEIFHGEFAFTQSGPLQALSLACSGVRPALALRAEHAHLAEAISACWDAEPARRPTATEVVRRLAEAPLAEAPLTEAPLTEAPLASHLPPAEARTASHKYLRWLSTRARRKQAGRAASNANGE